MIVIDNYNPNQIVSIKAVFKEENNWYEYQHEIKKFGITFRKERIRLSFDEYMSVSDFEESHDNQYVENSKVYNNPFILISFSNKDELKLSDKDVSIVAEKWTNL